MNDTMNRHQPYVLSRHTTGPVLEDHWPTVFFGSERMPEIRRKLAALEWAQAAVGHLRGEAEVVLQGSPQVPMAPCGWRHDFYSQSSAEHLVYDPDTPRSYVDPTDQSRHDSDAQQRAWRLLTHERTGRLMRGLGVLYQLDGDERFAAWVAAAMVRFVEYFAHSEWREGNRCEALYFQPLYDAQILLLLANAYSLTRPSAAYSDADHERIHDGIFAAGMPTMLRFLDEMGTHNMTCYVAAAIAVCGTVLGVEEWQRLGQEHASAGFAELLETGVRIGENGEPDGFWLEGTTFYHFYSICPLISVFELLRETLEPALTTRFATMFEAPVRICDAQLRVPCLGDLGSPRSCTLPGYRHLYEYAAGQFDSDLCRRALGAICAAGYRREGLTALAFGPDTVEPAPLRQTTTVLPRSGVVTFRRDDCFLLFRSGPHGAGHDHADKLNLDLRVGPELVSPDPGTAGYALKDLFVNGHRCTLSHNTLMVDEQNQEAAKAVTLDWSPERPNEAVGTVSDAYPGVHLTRRVRFAPPQFSVDDRCESDCEHRYAWLFHAHGDLLVHPQPAALDLGLPPLPDAYPFRWFSNRSTHCAEGETRLEWLIADRLVLHVAVTSDGPYEVTVGRMPGNPITCWRGTVMLRARGKERSFHATFRIA